MDAWMNSRLDLDLTLCPTPFYFFFFTKLSRLVLNFFCTWGRLRLLKQCSCLGFQVDVRADLCLQAPLSWADTCVRLYQLDCGKLEVSFCLCSLEYVLQETPQSIVLFLLSPWDGFLGEQTRLSVVVSDVSPVVLVSSRRQTNSWRVSAQNTNITRDTHSIFSVMSTASPLITLQCSEVQECRAQYFGILCSDFCVGKWDLLLPQYVQCSSIPLL